MLTQFFKSNQKSDQDYKEEAKNALIRKEAEVTRGIFGELTGGLKRDFYCVDAHTWVWYEEWTDKDGRLQHMTTRYSIQNGSIKKSQNGGPYGAVSIREARSLETAVHAYVKKVEEQLYSQPIAL